MKSHFGYKKSHGPTQNLPQVFSIPTTCREFRCFASQEIYLCLGASREVWVQGCMCGFWCEQLTWKELPCGRVGNKGVEGNWRKGQGAKKEAQRSHFRSEEHSPQCGVICVHLHLNKGQSVRLNMILLGRIFQRADVCSLISSCCCRACFWDM